MGSEEGARDEGCVEEGFACGGGSGVRCGEPWVVQVEYGAAGGDDFEGSWGEEETGLD